MHGVHNGALRNLIKEVEQYQHLCQIMIYFYLITKNPLTSPHIIPLPMLTLVCALHLYSHSLLGMLVKLSMAVIIFKYTLLFSILLMLILKRELSSKLTSQIGINFKYLVASMSTLILKATI